MRVLCVLFLGASVQTLRVRHNPQIFTGVEQVRSADDSWRSKDYGRNSPFDQLPSANSHLIQTVLPPETVLRKNPSVKEDQKRSQKFNWGNSSVNNLPSTRHFLPIVNLNENQALISEPDQNRTSRLFSLDTSPQSLNLGFSFTIPFISIPTQSLFSLGQTASSALTELLSFNYPAIGIAAAVIGVGLLVLPKVLGLILEFIGDLGFPGDYNNFKYGADILGSTIDSYGSYARSLNVFPFTTILEQLDDALKEYNLDSTSCMQRLVCTYMAQTDDKISKGMASSSHFLLKGFVGSSWVQKMLGSNALIEAIKIGSLKNSYSGLSSCSREFPKCPFSLPGIVKLLSSFVPNHR